MHGAGVCIEMLGDLGSQLRQGLFAVEAQPHRGTGAIQVVQVLAVEEHGLTLKDNPVDTVCASRPDRPGQGGSRVGATAPGCPTGSH